MRKTYREAGDAGQLTFADLDDDAAGGGFGDRALFDTTLVVVDLETTGSDPAGDRITEIGAVKIRGGEVLGEFATLVDPERSIPPQIVTLTGITHAMVSAAPRIEEVLPAFIEFARGSILVAHNARFDMGFLRRNAQRLHLDFPFPLSLCTVTMARRILHREEAPTVRLSALADLFDVSVRPTHRALDDARATVEVFHHLLERVGNQGVHSIRDLTEYLPRTDPQLRAKRHLADKIPARPGVYLFRGPSDEVLYVGTAVDLRRRVRSYFTGSDPRRRIGEMVRLAHRVDHVECSHGLEAAVRELRLLGAHAPAYNRKSKQPHRGWWVVLTAERFPRLKVSRSPSADTIGPVGNRTTAATIADVISAAAGLRTCTGRAGADGYHWCRLPEPGAATVGLCHASSRRPQTLTDYLPRVTAAAALMSGADDALLTALADRVVAASAAQMFETAARHRDRLALTIDALARCQRLAALCAVAQLIVARPDGARGWEFAVIRHGRLAGAGVARRGVAPMPVVDALVASAETVIAGDGPLLGAAAEEAALLFRWITEPDARIVACTEALALPARSAQRWQSWSATAHRARDSARHVPATHLRAS
ncbi:DNA polymerase III, epsilon subunit [Gordonia bronchialis DSM 43247]|uniref:DNA polymerase III, epsilon subunit n=1 Tax=Gordonia bronchialis (strain ATCC 25592 / DSM 43247 / BCRC 13721 / JCM 3198 / KCTC 3076 / NBRC 16047 / NCTC 10667) TaxID=526226 RepID=D0LAW5_GORB4|nr:DEDD exonuclease domain-containing protein [Gordonia bronchialis]ACY22258.1 DNA polymerase III, epsilon subunit [Gordonia bronchialis DSM 43247]MCC3325049.1 DEDD exonuclease domain-containing protein [Gordonia bronchialis]QGS24204.1 DEDD exonuclease domain-containing protein [Gordonia bronchialis]STQ65182.1 DNA polymerase III polC-type [Gordonia bronchialis]